MAEYVYPAVFHPNNDGSYTITFPDLPGCISEGKDLPNALYLAQDALKQWLEVALEYKDSFSPPSSLRDVQLAENEFVNLIRAEVRENKAVKRTVSLPKWMDDQAIQSGLSLSRVLQDALSDRLNIR